MSYQKLGEETQSSRRTVADVLEVLREKVDFTNDHRVTINVCPMKLPSEQVLGLVQILCHTPSETYIVSLPTSINFRATRSDASRTETFDNLQLDGATVDRDGLVKLTDGVLLRAVEVVPAHLPLEPSAWDWRIVSATVSALGSEKRCYRRLTDRAPRRFPKLRHYRRPRLLRRTARDNWFLDCRALRNLTAPPLKELVYRLHDLDPEFRKVSNQKIADALRMFGVRIPASRPRRASSSR